MTRWQPDQPPGPPGLGHAPRASRKSSPAPIIDRSQNGPGLGGPGPRLYASPCDSTDPRACRIHKHRPLGGRNTPHRSYPTRKDTHPVAMASSDHPLKPSVSSPFARVIGVVVVGAIQSGAPTSAKPMAPIHHSM